MSTTYGATGLGPTAVSTGRIASFLDTIRGAFPGRERQGSLTTCES